MKNILFFVIFIFVFVFLIIYLLYGSTDFHRAFISIAFLLIFGPSTGMLLGIEAYGFPYAIFVVASTLCIIVGLFYRGRIWGQAFTVLNFLFLILLMLLGLAQGG